ncbi:MAG: energy transducer TonB [Lysobacteraceae bacterium]
MARMSTVQPKPPQGSPSRDALSKPRFGLSRRVWWVVAGGFGAGFLLFLMLWLDMRNDGDFYRPESKTGGPDGQVFEPLPAPMADGDRSASGMSEAAEEALRNPPPPPPPPVAVPRPVETPARPPVADGSPQPNRPASGLAPGSVPVPISKPTMKYPADALRNGETGKVVVRIEVGADGEPTAVTIVSRSGSRSLDRAALQAAKQWRFRPAQQNGRAVAAAVEVPIAFTLEGR